MLEIKPNWQPSEEEVRQYVEGLRPAGKSSMPVRSSLGCAFFVSYRTYTGGYTVGEIHEYATDEWRVLSIKGEGKLYLVRGGVLENPEPLMKHGTYGVVPGELRGSAVIKGERIPLTLGCEPLFVPPGLPHCLHAKGPVDAVLLVIKS